MVAVCGPRTIGKYIVAKFSFRILDPRVRLSGGNFDLVRLLAGKDRPVGDVSDGLFQDSGTLTHFEESDVVSVVEVAVRARDDLELEPVVNAVGGCTADVISDVRGPQDGPGRREVDRLLTREYTNSLAAIEHDLVFR